MNMLQTIVPKSDQLNADDLIGRDLTIKITGVDIKGGQEQPVSIHFEGDNGKPYKACKSMCRIMVSAWGPDSSKYVGRSMTLYRDAAVKWGGLAVGGIRISHMSDLAEDLTMALTVTRANRKPFTVRPIASAPPEQREYDFALGNCTTLEELAAEWKKIPKSEQPKYAATKDARKATLTPAETGAI